MVSDVLPGPLHTHRYRDDSLSTAASQRLRVGQRELIALSDGFFSLTDYPQFLGSPSQPTGGADALVAEFGGEPRLPVGAFLLPGDVMTLIDAGIGPVSVGHGTLIGGNLLSQLARTGVSPEDVDVLALSHLHVDHIGWVADGQGTPTFPNAQVHVGAADWRHFVDGDPGGAMSLEPHILAGLLHLADNGRVTLLDDDRQIAPGVTRIAAPGHTPGHSVYAVHDGDERALLLGDAMYCPAQLTHADWGVMSDIDPQLARTTREHLLRSLDEAGGIGLGCHFPGLRAGRVVGGAWQPA